MIVTEKDLENYPMICCIYNNHMEVGQKYEKITKHSKKKIIVHTDCIGK